MNQRNEIIKKYNSGNYTRRQLSDEYNIYITGITKILNHKIKRFEVLG